MVVLHPKKEFMFYKLYYVRSLFYGYFWRKNNLPEYRVHGDRFNSWVNSCLFNGQNSI